MQSNERAMVARHRDERGETTRVLARQDGVGLTAIDVTYRAGADMAYQDKDYVEVVYCLRDEAGLAGMETGVVHPMHSFRLL